MYETIEQIKAANEEAGRYFFSPGAMRFFDSRILDGVYGGRYFVTSEKGDWPGAERGYTIREAHEDGDVTTVGELQEYATREEAINAAKRMAS